MRSFLPTLLREDDVSVLTETVRLLRAALGLDVQISDKWREVLPEDTVERLIHIIQVNLLRVIVLFLLIVVCVWIVEYWENSKHIATS